MRKLWQLGLLVGLVVLLSGCAARLPGMPQQGKSTPTLATAPDGITLNVLPADPDLNDSVLRVERTGNNGPIWLRVATQTNDLDWLKDQTLPTTLKNIDWSKQVLLVVMRVAGRSEALNLKLLRAELSGTILTVRVAVGQPPNGEAVSKIASGYSAAALLSKSELPHGPLTIQLVDEQGKQLDTTQINL